MNVEQRRVAICPLTSITLDHCQHVTVADMSVHWSGKRDVILQHSLLTSLYIYIFIVVYYQ